MTKKDPVKVIEELTERLPHLDFSKFKYAGNRIKSTVICHKHGEFEACRFNLLQNGLYGCRKCFIDSLRMDIEKKIQEVKEKYPNLDFSKFNPKTDKEKSIIFCKEHGEIYNSIYNLLNYKYGQKDSPGCPYCSQKRVLEPIKELENRYPHLDFSKFEYINSSTKSTVICPEHGEFQSSYKAMIKNKNACIYCSGNAIKNPIENLSNKFPNLDFNKFVFTRVDDSSIVICPKHGEFKNTYRNLMSEDNFYGCKGCSRCGISRYEEEIEAFIKSLNPDINLIRNTNKVIRNYNSPRNSPMELDFYFPDINLAIEFNGVYWHSDKRSRKYFKTQEDYHNYKTEECLKKGIKLIHIAEEDYLNNKDKILEEIKANIT